MIKSPPPFVSVGAIARDSREARHQGSENSALKKIAESSLMTRSISDNASIDPGSLASPFRAVPAKDPGRWAKSWSQP